MIAERVSSRAERDDFGVPAGIGGRDRNIVTGGDNFAARHDHGTNRHFAGRLGLPRRIECGVHILSVFG